MAGLRFRSLVLLVALAVVAILGTSLPVLAGPATTRQIQLMEDSDFFGRDIQVLKEVELETCQSACLATEACRAFTYNVKARWCFLKDRIKDRRTFVGAVSGQVVEARADGANLAERRAAELSFLPADRLKSASRLAQGLAALIPAEIAASLQVATPAELTAMARSAPRASNASATVRKSRRS